MHCRSFLAYGAALALAAGCATGPQLEAQWASPDAQVPGLLRGARVMVACEAPDAVVRQICQDRLASEVVAHGATAVQAPAEMLFMPDRPVDAQLLPEARVQGASAVIVMSVVVAYADPGPTFSFGIGGWGYGGGGGAGGAGVGISGPAGGGHMTPGYAANGRVTDASNGRIVWLAKASTRASPDVAAQMAELSRTVVGAAQQSGLF
jgi:hypothetical protein